MGKISVVINVVPEDAYTLTRALTSIKEIASEIVLVDMSSGDREIERIAKKFEAKIFRHEFVNYVEPARNFGLSKASGDWILVLDPDEEVGHTLAKRLIRIANDSEAKDYYLLPRKNVVFGKWLHHAHWWPDYNVRFFKKGKVVWSKVIHAPPVTKGQGAEMSVKREYAIIHHHYETISGFLKRLDRYTDVQALNKMDSGYVFDWRDILKKPFSEFLSRYFAGEGYRDGFHGLALCLLQAFSELVLYLKLWEQAANFEKLPIGPVALVKEIKPYRKEFFWWYTQARMSKKGFVGKLFLRAKRKIFLR